MSNDDSLDDLSTAELDYTLIVDKQADLLVVDDEVVIHQVLASFLEDSGWSIDFVTTAEEALKNLERKEYNLLVVDKNLPGMSGIELMREVRKRHDDVEFIVITAYASYESAIEAMRLGAFDYIEKPFSDLQLVREKLNRALERQHLTHENRLLIDQLRTAHQEVQRGLQAFGESVGDVKTVNMFMRQAVNKATREITIQNIELKRGVLALVEPLRQARRALRQLGETGGAPAQVGVAHDLVEQCWGVLSSQVQKVKDLS